MTTPAAAREPSQQARTRGAPRRLRDLERDFYLTAPEALAYGLIDSILDGASRRATVTADG